jgi:hypothetical protein
MSFSICRDRAVVVKLGSLFTQHRRQIASPVGHAMSNDMNDKKISTCAIEDLQILEQLSREKTANLADIVGHSTAIEHDLGTWEAIKVYKPAVLWSLVYSACVIMEG